jgi:hypothetical protein
VHRLSKHYCGCPDSKLIACTAIFAWIFFVFAKMIIMQNSAWIFLSHKAWGSMQPKWPSRVNALGFAYAQIMGLEGAVFTFPLCTFAQKNWCSNISPITCSLVKHFNRLQIYNPLNSLTTPYIQEQLHHMSVEKLINFQDSLPKKFNTEPWDSLFLFTKFCSKNEIYFWKHQHFYKKYNLFWSR